MKTKLKKTLGLVAIVIGAAGTIAATGNWNTKVVETERGHLVGNPEAKTTLTEFVSYTCPHCAHFAIEGEAPLQMAYVGPGKMKMEIRPYIRNVVDLVASRLVQCGPEKKFLQNHTMFMIRQSSWLPIAQKATPAQLQRWARGDAAGFREAASALGFYDMMKTRGYDNVAVDTCLADKAAMDKLVANTLDDAKTFGVKSTPSFAVDGKLLPGVHGWPALQKALSTNF